ncbi:MAG TPA: signal peptidase I [Gemmatimonadaceae bacterium]|nr:signal peptidase I [Gemmatimonadaceae bacterium]
MAKKRSTSSKNVVAQAREGGGGRNSAPKTPLQKRIWENVKSVAGAVLVYLVLKTFLVEAFRIPSGSMIPSLLIGDWLFVNKLVYGPHIPFTRVNLPGYADPKSGDVVVFMSPYQPDLAEAGEDPNPTLVKRLIGMPGDTVYMRDGLLHVNGLPQRQGYAASVNPKGNGDEYSPLMDWQHKIELSGTRFGPPPRRPTLDNWGPLLIPPSNYFMMGDNRYQSKDSRYWGIVPRANVRGRPMFIYYTYVPQAESDRPLSFITDIRWGRIGHWVR